MYPFDNTIGLEHEKLAAILRFHYSTVITRSRDNRFPWRKAWQKLIEQPVFAEITKFHGEKVSGNARAVRVTEMNSGTNEGKCACAAANSKAVNITPRRRPK